MNEICKWAIERRRDACCIWNLEQKQEAKTILCNVVEVLVNAWEADETVGVCREVEKLDEERTALEADLQNAKEENARLRKANAELADLVRQFETASRYHEAANKYNEETK